jgi:hypothetical protein
MSFTIKRKQLVFAGLAVSLAAAMFVNWYYTRPATQTPVSEAQTEQSTEVNLGDAQFVNAVPADDYFAKAQLERSKAQDEAKHNLEEIIKSSEADTESKNSAEKALEELSENIVVQAEIESFIKAKSGGEVLVSLGNTAEVILQKGTLNDELCLQITDIITRKTNIISEKITIIEAK